VINVCLGQTVAIGLADWRGEIGVRILRVVEGSAKG